MLLIVFVIIVLLFGAIGENYITFLFEREKYYLYNNDYKLDTTPVDDIEVVFSCSEDMEVSINLEEYNSTLVIDECRFNENGMYLHIVFKNSSKYKGASIVAFEELDEDYVIPNRLDIYVSQQVIGDTYSQAGLIADGGHEPYEDGILEYTLLFMGVPPSVENIEYTLYISEMIVNIFTKK